MERPALNRRSSSRRSQHHESITSPPNSSPQHKRLHKVGGYRTTGLHSRVPSTQKLKSQIQHGAGGEPMKRANSFSKLSRNGSTTSLKKNQSTLKRNKSAAEVRTKAAGTSRRQQLQGHKPTAVHFEVGLKANDEENEDADGWTEASNSASPVVSRRSSASRPSSGMNSARPSANNTQPQSPTAQKSYGTNAGDAVTDSQDDRFQASNATQITSKLLNRIPSQSAAPKMSPVSATVTPGGRSPESVSKSQGSNPDGNSNSDKPQISRFLGRSTSATPTDSPILSNGPSNGAKTNLPTVDLTQSKRVMSMGNLIHKPDPSSEEEAEEERALAPPSRITSITCFNPALSRTQQKQWLQRASSAIEPQQLSRDRFSKLPPFGPGTPLIEAAYDSRDPRIRAQLERTGLEYLVIRRYQNPLGAAIKRLDQISGIEKSLRVPANKGKSSAGAAGRKDGKTRPQSEIVGSRGAGTAASSQNASQNSRHSVDGGVGNKSRLSNNAGKPSQAQENGNLSGNGQGQENNGVKEVLRRIWEKNCELSTSQD